MAETLKVDKPQGTPDVKSADEAYLLDKGWTKDLARAHTPEKCWYAPWNARGDESRPAGQTRVNGRMEAVSQKHGSGIAWGYSLAEAVEMQRARDRAAKGKKK